MRNYLLVLSIGIAIGFGIARLVLRDRDVESEVAEVTAEPSEFGRSVGGRRASPTSGTGEAGSARGESREELFARPVATPGQFDAYLERHQFSKEALLAAIRLDPDFQRHILEAAKRFPDDPHIQFLVITHKVLPEEHSEWVERFKTSQPDNAYASVLYGTDLLNQGKTKAALEQLRLAGMQQSVDDFSHESWLAGDSAMIEFGFTPLEAKLKGTFTQALPFFGDFQKMLKSLQGIAKAESDPAERIEIATIGAALGNQFTQGNGNSTLIHRLVGIASERRFLMLLEPDAMVPSLSEPPAVLLEQLDREQAEIHGLVEKLDPLATEFSDAELQHYLDRVRLNGELEAVRWALPSLDD